MGDKIFVLRDLRVSYNGSVDIAEFMEGVDRWINQNGYEKEQKKYTEHLNEGKKIEWVVEGHKTFSKWVTGTIRLRALFDNLKEHAIKIKGRKAKITKGDALIYIDGIIDSRLKESLYHSKPLFHLAIILIDKYVYRFWSGRYYGNVVSDGNSLYKNVRAFFSLQKYKFQE